MVALLLILRDCGVAAKNTLFKHFLGSDRPQLSSARTKNQLSNVPSEIFSLKRNRQRNLHEQICNFREQVVRAGCKLLRGNCQSKYQHCGRSLQSCAEKNIRFDCNHDLLLPRLRAVVIFPWDSGARDSDFFTLVPRGSHFAAREIGITISKKNNGCS